MPPHSTSELPTGGCQLGALGSRSCEVPADLADVAVCQHVVPVVVLEGVRVGAVVDLGAGGGRASVSPWPAVLL